MNRIARVRVDLGKYVPQVHAVNAEGNVVT
jgi:hypothetical protein